MAPDRPWTNRVTAAVFIRLRKILQKTQPEMASLLGVSVRAIRSYEQGWRPVPVHVERHTVTSVRLDRGMAGKFVGQNRLVVVSWRAPDGQIYDTGFLPRYKTDTDALIEAVNRLIEDGDL